MEQRIYNVQQALDAAYESGNDETKSSAGDKHETGKAMMQLQQETNARQLQEALELKQQLGKINPTYSAPVISPGSVVLTDKGNFYISIGAGKLELNSETYYAVSPLSPLAKVLLGAKKGDTPVFSGQTYKVLDIC